MEYALKSGQHCKRLKDIKVMGMISSEELPGIISEPGELQIEDDSSSESTNNLDRELEE